ncbi:hypothetical protein AXK56_20220 [Tsukamurella pulmonis]|uniref:Tryptophan-associated transmembrane protein (Trp_oprn_chp) n=1 Tax=Tsukamurella pulmonis TaxID=47312 RepID=A0A1H1HAT6_9ACTN|nr:hypothetical protein [Tsukamurella pulmonis]KXO94918.1 hypothetical protein AXK56_20220 [Tsukamurella pulmonis]SDR22146.1 hypothetical protein SAMN04489765_3948 [Tsukamurella pulmonis]SUP15506.1 SSP-5 [Tsukamurella pulmonis]
MPDSSPASASRALRIGGLVLVVAGAAGLVVAAFLDWYRVTASLPESVRLGDLPSSLEARVSGLGRVSMAPVAGQDLSSTVPTQMAWGGIAVLAIAVGALLTGAVAAVGPANRRTIGVAGTVAFTVFGFALGAYALLVPIGTQTVTTHGLSLRVETTAALGPWVVIAAAAVLGVGGALFDRARHSAARSAAAPSAPAPRVPAPSFPSAPPAVPRPGYAPSNRQAPTPDAAWARPAAPAPPVAPVPPPLPEAQVRTAVAPVARRRPQPDWDRNWPAAVPPQPGPATPSEQRTQVVRRPPRPVKVSPRPETEAIPRDPRFDAPTEPL